MILLPHPSGHIDILPPFPEVWDSSMRSAWVSCPRSWYYSYLLGLRKAGPSVHLHFGGAIAKGLEAARRAFYKQGLDEIQAVAAGMTAIIKFWGDYELTDEIKASRAGVKDLSGCLDALFSYFETYPLATDQIKPIIVGGEPLIEKSFALPVPGTKHPITGEPVVYAGRFDMVGEYNNAVFIVDEKTTLSLGQMWASNWPLRGQLSGYCWGARSFGIEPSGVLIRGLGILKQSINFQQALLSRPEWLIERWLGQVTRDINRAAEMWSRAADAWESKRYDRPHDFFDQAFDSACSSYGGCGYLMLDESEDPRQWYDNYQISHWDPLQRDSDP
jgi:PD-(D/E)XK nuclease superfamily